MLFFWASEEGGNLRYHSQLTLQPASSPGVVVALEEGKKQIQFWELELGGKI